MEAIILNQFSMNETIKMVLDASERKNGTRFRVQCDNCMLSIIARKLPTEVSCIEIGLRSVDDSGWIEIEGGSDDFPYTIKQPIIGNLPIMLLPAMIMQFQRLDTEDFDMAWEAYETLSHYR